MDSSTIYIKTAKGSEEIASRAHGLSSRARGMLIMVDGRRNGGILLGQSAERAEAELHLATLLDGGFIAVVSQPAPAEMPAAQAAAAPQTASVPTIDLPALKQYIASTLHSILGPDADMFTMKVEAAKSVPELLMLTEKLLDVIRSVGGKKKADDFQEKIATMLS